MENGNGDRELSPPSSTGLLQLKIVNAQAVLLKVRALLEGSLADVANVWTQFQMAVVDVATETVREAENLVTLVAVVRARLVVPCLNMLLEVRFLGTAILAKFAREILHFFVHNAHVLTHSRGFAEELVAEWTLQACLFRAAHFSP